METIPFIKKDIKDYLDNAIKHWRIKKENVMEGQERLIASCYIDAFQSVRMTLFGELKE
ncbi:hypothetical protein LCGC14_1814310 [marine sediment metagenome]|uniref:Uncharacterized protein n=1 Tax=marine sediment metagenome TaxID=412755 RepID=A0A0F9GKZ2_9ZZZZ